MNHILPAYFMERWVWGSSYNDRDQAELVWPFYQAEGVGHLYSSTGDVTRQDWEIPYIQRVRQLNWTLRNESSYYQQVDAEEPLPSDPRYPGPAFYAFHHITGMRESIYLTEEPSIENLREMNTILSSSDLGVMGVNCDVDWTGGFHRGYDYRYTEEGPPPGSQPPGWEINIDAEGLCEDLPWNFNRMWLMDGKSVYKLARAEDGKEEWDFEKTDEIVTDEDLAILHEDERSRYLKKYDACCFIYSAAREAGLVFDESEAEEQQNSLKELSERDFAASAANDQAWQAARSKALSGHEPTRIFKPEG